MGRRVLVALDGSPQSWEAFDYALEEYPDAELLALNVIDPIDASYAGRGGALVAGEEWYENRKEAAEQLFDEARERAGDRAVETAVEVGRPARSIVDYADDADVDTIVVGSHGRSGVARILLGSVAETVVRRSSVPVVVVR